MTENQELNTLENTQVKQASIETQENQEVEKKSPREKLAEALDTAMSVDKQEKTEQQTENKELKPKTETIPQQQTEVINAPHSWKTEIKADWDKIPESAKKYISEREQGIERKLSDVNQEVNFSRQMQEAINPYNDFLRAEGAKHPAQAVQTLLNTAYTLRHASPTDKVKILANIARDYGVDLNLLNQPQENIDPAQAQFLQQQNALYYQNQQIAHRTAQLEQHINAQQQQSQQQYFNSVIDQFKQGKDDFDILAEDITNLVQTPAYANLDPVQALSQAYEVAKYHNPAVRQKLINSEVQAKIQAQKQADIQAAKERVNKAKNMSSSIKGSSGARTVETKQRRNPRDEIARMLTEAGVA